MKNKNLESTRSVSIEKKDQKLENKNKEGLIGLSTTNNSNIINKNLDLISDPIVEIKENFEEE